LSGYELVEALKADPVTWDSCGRCAPRLTPRS
jgi:hypothetical protein